VSVPGFASSSGSVTMAVGVWLPLETFSAQPAPRSVMRNAATLLLPAFLEDAPTDTMRRGISGGTAGGLEELLGRPRKWPVARVHRVELAHPLGARQVEAADQAHLTGSLAAMSLTIAMPMPAATADSTDWLDPISAATEISSGAMPALRSALVARARSARRGS